MALVLSPWFGRGCGRRARPFSFGSPSLFTDLVIIKVPQMQRQASSAPVQGRSPAVSNARVVQWAETADSNIFRLRLPGLRKEDLHIQVEDDGALYISYSNQPKGAAKDVEEAQDVKDAKAGEAAPDAPQSKEQKSGGCSFMRKFKLPENAALEQIKAEVTDETLTVTVPKRKPKSVGSRNIEVREGEAPATNVETTSSATPSHEGRAAAKSEQPSASEAKPSTTSG